MNTARKHNKPTAKSKSKGNNAPMFIVSKSPNQKTTTAGKKSKIKPGFIKPKTKNKKKKGVKKIPKVVEMVDENIQIIKTPTKPSEDKAFRKTLRHIKKVKEEQKAHQPIKNKQTELKEASRIPVGNQIIQKNRNHHFETISSNSESTKSKKFTPEGFKESLKKELDALEKTLPKSESAAEDFKDDEPLTAIKRNVGKDVSTQKTSLVGQLENEAKIKEAPNSKSEKPLIEAAKSIPNDPPGTKPKSISKKAATPKPKHPTEISMEKESKSLDTAMDENKITDAQLARSNEPKFTEALDSKNEAKTEAKKAPETYKKAEKKKLYSAKKQAGLSGDKNLHAMFKSRLGNFGAVLDMQVSSRDSDINKQNSINSSFKGIYDTVKSKVTTELESLTDTVDAYFEDDGEVTKAMNTFENNVEDELDEIYGFTAIDDAVFSFFAGRDINKDAIKNVFAKEKATFISALDTIFNTIAKTISNSLNRAIGFIDGGRTETKIFYDGLSTDQKKLAKDSLENFMGRYDDLEETVKDKESELAKGLARKYKQNVDSLQEKFDEIKERVSATFIEAAINFVKKVIETIIKIKNLLFSLLASVISAITAIIDDPIGFLKNLFSGIRLGFENFFSNIKTHMITGVIEWLTGSLGGVGITIPDNLFSLKGMFNLTLQILGLSWDYFRSKAVILLGEPVVEGMEKSVEVFTIIKEKGVSGLWEYVKDQFTDLKEVVMDAIRDMVITKVVDAGIKWIMGLLSPAGAFVKAAMLIIDVVKFFVERAAQIFELVEAFINGIRALANGNVEKLANSIEKALAKTLPILIGFLAALVGVTGLTGKVQKIIKRIRKRIDKAINKVIKKARKIFGGLVKKGKVVVKKGLKKLFSWFKITKKFKAKDGKTHSLSFTGNEKNPKLIVKSEPKDFETLSKELLAGNDGAKKGEVTKAIQVYKSLRSEINKKVDKDDTAAQEKKSKNIEKYLSELSKYTAAFFTHNEGDLPEYKEGKNVIFDSKNSQGVGTKMNAIELSKKGVKGTVPSVKPETYSTLFKRKKGKGIYYVRGHLLNENIHGPGNDPRNLTPLTVKGNKNHLMQAEKILKFVTAVGGVVKYVVKPVYKNRGLETKASDQKDKFSDEEWKDVIKIREVENVAVPTHLNIDAELLEKNDKGKFVAKKVIFKGNIDNDFDGKIENYQVGENGESKEEFKLIDKISELQTLSGIGPERAKKIHDRLKIDKKPITNYKDLIGIEKSKLDKLNPKYKIIGTL